ncbi:MAG: glycosyltransferase family 4 protein [Gammaproteobacteria bacterium]|nr:glycosyltransferase family 4 protein [Gammaproteobacteria bacterium]
MTAETLPTAASPGILYVLPWSIDAIGGVSQVVSNLIRQGRKTGQARPVLFENCPEHTTPHTTTRADGLIQVQLWVRTPLACPSQLRTTLGFLLWLPGTLLQLRELLKSHRINTVNAHYPSLAAVHFRLLSILGLFSGRLILSFHGLDVRAAANSTGVERIIWRWLLRTSDGIATCSHALGRDIAAFEPRCSGRITVIHNGVDPETLAMPAADDLPRELGKAPYILSVGTFEHKKGQDVLLEAFSTLKTDFPELRLVLVGRSTPFLDVLRASVTRLGLKDRVLLRADIPHERIAPYYARAAAFCLPSRAEPFGIVILEAALFDLPVVATAVGGIVEIIRSDIDGILVTPEDPERLAAALRVTLTDVPAARQRAESLKQRVTNQFTWYSAFLQYLRLA